MLCLTQPWAGTADPVGVAFALAAAACWAAYILLTQKVGDAVSGIGGLAISMPVAAIVATVVAGPGVVGQLTPELLLVGLGLAILLPVVPFTLELLALRRLTAGAFGTLMALEPAFALVIGFVALHQVPNLLAVLGVGLVVAAGIGAERSGARLSAPVAEGLKSAPGPATPRGRTDGGTPGAAPAPTRHTAEQPHRRGHQHSADQSGVDQDRQAAAEAEQLHEADLAGAEGEEADREQRGRGGDDASGARQPVRRRPPRVRRPASWRSLMRLSTKTS